MRVGNQIYKRCFIGCGHSFLSCITQEVWVPRHFFFSASVFSKGTWKKGEWNYYLLKICWIIFWVHFCSLPTLTLCNKKEGWIVRNNGQPVSMRDEGWKGHLSFSSDLTEAHCLWVWPSHPCLTLSSCERGTHMSNFHLSFTPLLPPGLQLSYVISIYINFNVVCILKFHFGMLLNLWN